MAPPCAHFSVEKLSERVQEDVKGKRRKLPDGAKQVDLSACELLHLPQYKCEVEQPVTTESQIICQEVTRFFRRCKDRKGPFTVETTAWEFSKTDDTPATGSDSSKSTKPYQWGSSWVEADSHDPS